MRRTLSENTRPAADAQTSSLRLLFTKLDWSICKLVSPVDPSRLGDLAVPLIPTLRDHLLNLAPLKEAPELLRGISGPRILVDTLLDGWPHPHDPEPSMHMKPGACSVAPTVPAFPPGHSCARVEDFDQLDAADAEALPDLFQGFWGDHISAPKLDHAGKLAHIRQVATEEALWLYRAPPPSSAGGSSTPVPIGFVHTGRPTPRTCAIRGVFVDPAHRSQGVATRMVAHVTRAHLADAPRLEIDWSRPLEEQALEDPATKWGGKDEVCLFVEPGNPHAEQAYVRVGYRFGDVPWCDADLQGVERGHW